MNHLNAKISNPWLKNNSGIAPADGILVWQDAYKLIEPDSVFMTSDQMYICFKVNKDKICQGNALLSVRNASKTILWSWHIWVTDEAISSATENTFTNSYGSVYGFMKVALGHCDADRRTYAPRKVKFRFEQDKTRKITEVTFEQTSTKYIEYGLTAPYYQFGRSVPLRIQNGKSVVSKTLFFHADYSMPLSTSAVSTGIAIRYPTTVYDPTNGDWNTTARIPNLWDVTYTGSPTVYDKSSHKSVKSIYDPSPVGYKVPEPASTLNFTVDGGMQSNLSNINTNGPFDGGWYIYTKPNKQGKLVFFPLYGYFYQQGFWINGVGYWLSGPGVDRNSMICGLQFVTTDTWVHGVRNIDRVICENVWPVADD